MSDRYGGRVVTVAKRALAGLLLCLLLVLAGAAVLLAHVDAGWLAEQINRHVLADRQRVLKIEGPLKLDLLPVLHLEVQGLSLSEHASTATFVRLERAAFSLQWQPLFARRLAIDALTLDGLSMTVERDAAGRYNFADLLEKQETSASPWTVALASLQLKQGRVLWKAAQENGPPQEITVDDIDLRSGRLASSDPPVHGELQLAARLHSASAPQFAGHLHGQTQYQYTWAEGRPQGRLHTLTLKAQGRLAGQPDAAVAMQIGSLTLSSEPSGPVLALADLQLQAQLDAPVTELSFVLPRLTWQAPLLQAGQARLQLHAHRAQEKNSRQPEMTLQVAIKTDIVADMAARSLRLDALACELDINAGQQLARPLHLALQGGAQADLAQQKTTLQLTGRLDESHLAGRLEATGSRLAAMQLDFALDVDRFNVDDYLKQSSSATSTARGSSTGGRFELPAGLNLQGQLMLGRLQVAGVTARNLRLSVSTRQGRLQMQTMAR